ncbi:MAG TPA: hypothetical protein VIL86_00940 [Tepidisphaeraceae bacterium]|jgi:hypothetical protein
MRRKLFNFLAAVSLALFFGVVVVTVRSFLANDQFVYLKVSKAGVATRSVIGAAVEWRRGRFEFLLGRFIATTPEQIQSLPQGLKPIGFSHRRDSAYYTNEPIRLDTSSSLTRAAAWFGFAIAHVTDTPGSRDRKFSISEHAGITFPAWFLALLFAILPTLWLRRWRIVRRRNRLGLCQHCGYDLRATPDRCPECGTTASPPAAAV